MKLSALLSGEKPALWACDAAAEHVILRREVPAKDAAGLVAAFNADRKGPPSLRLVKLDRTTAVVEVVDAEHLTQRMGTTGAQCFVAAATYTITSARGVEAVRLEFEEGDHAVPGRYQRVDFSSMLQIWPDLAK